MMKKWTALFLCLCLCLTMGFAAAETAAETETRQIAVKNLKVYYDNLDTVWREEFPVYYADGVEDLPYIDLSDWKDLLLFVYGQDDSRGDNKYGLTMVTDETEKKVTLVRESGVSMDVDFAEGTLGFVDFVGFNTPANGEYMDVRGFPSTLNGQPFLLQSTKSRILYGDYTLVDLKERGIPMIWQDGKALIPLQTLNAFTLISNSVAVYCNGQALYVAAVQKMVNPSASLQTMLMMAGLVPPELVMKVQAMEGTMEEKINFVLDEVSKASEMGAMIAAQYREMLTKSIYLHYTSAPKAQRSEALTAYGFNELALEMDCFYGLKETHNIQDFSTFFLQNDIGVRLLDPDAGTADAAVADMTMFWFDDGHSDFLSPSWMTEALSSQPNYGLSLLSRDSLSNELQAIRSQYPEAAQPYYEVGDTAYVTFDTFAATPDEQTGGVRDYYALAEEGKLPLSETVALVHEAHKQITRENSPIKNVVLDLSMNGGGAAPTAFFTLGWFLGEANYSYINTFTGAQATRYFRADVNLDHEFDEKDTLAGRGLNLFCLISPKSFSCGNLVPWVFKESGAVTLLGRTSGGGSCVVGFDTTAWGTSFRYSSSNRLAFVKNGSYYDVDKGVEPDFVISNYRNFFDREALTKYIQSLY